MGKIKEYIGFNPEWVESLRDFPPEFRVQVYEAAILYASSGEVPDDLEPMAKLAFSFIKYEIDRCRQLSEVRRESGRKGGRQNRKVNDKKDLADVSTEEGKDHRIESSQEIGCGDCSDVLLKQNEANSSKDLQNEANEAKVSKEKEKRNEKESFPPAPLYKEKENKKEKETATPKPPEGASAVAVATVGERRKKVLNELFSKQIQLESFCASNHTSPEELRRLAEEVFDEWTLVNETDLSERHLINAIRIKLRKERGRAFGSERGNNSTYQSANQSTGQTEKQFNEYGTYIKNRHDRLSERRGTEPRSEQRKGFKGTF